MAPVWSPDVSGTTHTWAELVTFGTDGPESLESDTQVTIARTDDNSVASFSATLGAVGSSYTALLVYTPVDLRPNISDQIWTLSTSGYSLALRRRGNDLICDDLGNGYTMTAPDFFAEMNVPKLIGVTSGAGGVAILGTGQAMASPTGSVTGGTLYVGVAPGIYSQVAVIPSRLTEVQFADLSAKLTGQGSGTVSDWLNRACTEAGISTSVNATFNRTMERPALKGSNPAQVGATLSNSAGAMFAADRSGVPTWYDQTYCPAWVQIAAGDWDNETRWAPDQSLYYSEVQFDGVVAATVPGAWPRKALDVQPLLTATDQANYTTFLVNAQDVITAPRSSQVHLDLATLSNSATYQALDLRSRIALQTVPSQVPSGGVMTVEGYSVSVSAVSWDLTLNTAPDPRFVVGDSIAGVVGSNYRIGW